MEEDSLIREIKHYQRRLQQAKEQDKYPDILHCLRRLAKMPIALKQLEQTGIGKTVNGLRSYKDEVGDQSNLLVAKWKKIVKDEVTADTDPYDDESGSEYSDSANGYEDTDDREDKHEINMNGSSKENQNKLNQQLEKSTESRRKLNESKNDNENAWLKSEDVSHVIKLKVTTDKETDKHGSHSSLKRKRNDYKEHHNVHKAENVNKKVKSENNELKNKPDSKKHNILSKHDKESSKSVLKKEKLSSVLKTSDKHSFYKSSPDDNFVDDHTNQNQEDHTSGCNIDLHLGDKNVESNDDIINEWDYENIDEGHIKGTEPYDNNFKIKHDYNEKIVEEENIYNESENENDNFAETVLRIKKEISDDIIPENSPDNQKVHHKSSHISSHEKKHKSSKNSKELDSSSSTYKDHHGSKKHSSSNHRSGSHSSSSKKSESRSDKHSSSHKKEHNKDGHRDKKCDRLKSDHIKESKSDNKRKEYSSSHSSRSKSRDSEKSQPKDHKKRKQSTERKLEIGNEGGDGGFGAALMEISTKTVGSPKKKALPPKVRIIQSSPSPSANVSFPINSPEGDLLAEDVQLGPLDVDVSALSSDDDFTYQQDAQQGLANQDSKLSEEDALISIMTTKNQKTKVFSGCKSKVSNKIVSLFEQCVRVLQENIECLEYTGGVPYMVIKPVLQRTTSEQLALFEKHNTYVQDETDELWEFHVKKEFRNAVKTDNESWRELYIRCKEEREEKLQSLKENINLSIANSTPVRKTKLAYFDSSYVKPPRNIAKRQATNGIVSEVIRPIGKRTSNELGPSASSIQSVKERLSAHFSEPTALKAPVSKSSMLLKKKPAPLMQKVLQLMKGCRR